MNRIALIAIFCVLLMVTSACQQPTPTPSPTNTPTPTEEPTATTAPPTPTSEPTATLLPPTPTAVPEPQDLVATIRAIPELSALAAALESADLIEKLESAGPFTIFAPANSAFAAVAGVDMADPDVLFDVLLFHIAAGEIGTSDLNEGDSITTLLGDELPVAAGVAGPLIGDATITSPDIVATNGIIHIVDSVQIPVLE